MRNQVGSIEVGRVHVVASCVIAPALGNAGGWQGIDLEPDTVLGPDRGRRLDRLSQLALVAIDVARKDAGIALNRRKAVASDGVAIGSALGAIGTTVRYAQRLVEAGPAATNPIDFPDSIDGAPAAHVALDLGLGGPSVTFTDGRSSAISALVYAARQVAWGRAQRMYVVVGDKLDGLFGAALAADAEFCSDAKSARYFPAECVLALVLQSEPTEPTPEVVGFLANVASDCAPGACGVDGVSNHVPSRSTAASEPLRAAPLTWVLGEGGETQIARDATGYGKRLRDPSGALDLAAAWLGTIGQSAVVIGMPESAVPGPIATRVFCGNDDYPQLGFIGSRG